MEQPIIREDATLSGYFLTMGISSFLDCVEIFLSKYHKLEYVRQPCADQKHAWYCGKLYLWTLVITPIDVILALKIKIKIKFLLAPMGVLAPRSAHARPSAQPPLTLYKIKSKLMLDAALKPAVDGKLKIA